MYLKQLKLAGFKSFVDPVTIPLHSSLVAVVGPNGCGKSNIIDAVRWVMGESSAKNLRGETMSDVIFSGSSQRKALGQASVELLFDNSMGLLSGEYGRYQEISVKRLVTRDGESSYFLNGTRCRRRDITDLFLGTGAGSRSYSIIGQGTISRLIEARPDELRAYLEEAAGTSKYKERRRETLQRIAATRENLQRVSDIRDELEKQLQRLEQQAKTANRYKGLCAKERNLKAEIACLKWQVFDKQRHELNEQIQQLNLIASNHQAKATHAYQMETQLRLQWAEGNDALQAIQTHFYQQTADIARLEEQLAQQQREKQRLSGELEQLKGDCLQLTEQMKHDTRVLDDHRQEHAYLHTQIETFHAELAEKQMQTQALETEEQALHNRLIQLQQALNQSHNTMTSLQIEATHHEQRVDEIKTRLQDNLGEQEALEVTSQDVDVLAQEAKRASLQDEVTKQEEILQEAIRTGQQLASQLTAIDQSVHQQKNTVHQLSTRFAGLDAWLATALGRQETLLSDWSANRRLAEVMDVEEIWAPVVDMILGDILQGIVIEDLPMCIQTLHQTPLDQGVFVTPQLTPRTTSQLPRLVDKIHGVYPQYVFNIEKIYAASTFEEALTWLPLIGCDESIVTQDGHWLGQGWLRVFNVHRVQETSILARQKACCEVQKELEQEELSLSRYLEEREVLCIQIEKNNQERLSLQQQLSNTRESLRACLSELTNQQHRREQFSIQTEHLTGERARLTTQLEALQQAQSQNKQQALKAKQADDKLKADLMVFNEERALVQHNLKPYRQEAEDIRKKQYDSELKIERVQLKIKQLEQSLLRDKARHDSLGSRLSTTQTKLAELTDPKGFSQEDLTQKLTQQQALEHVLNEKKHQISSLSNELEQYTRIYKEEEANALAVKDKMQQIQIEEQVLLVKANGALEGLTQLGYALDEVLQSISAQAVLINHEQELVNLVDKMKRLGAINLAAIDEYEVESERKKYLDQQSQDLSEALALLESAITKIDQDMQQRFQTMFVEVNTRFQDLFPRLFGGGYAALELTCDNLLEAGVNVMAQPPGKRNRSIYLLSGGEKAMTAIALIFAIFQSNPSPFCMLDEVDAPLDEVNISRFCALMKEMAECVQFLFTTHNKVTLLMAEQLIGVTMREAGVSRLVAVDVEQALLMSETGQ